MCNEGTVLKYKVTNPLALSFAEIIADITGNRKTNIAPNSFKEARKQKDKRKNKTPIVTFQYWKTRDYSLHSPQRRFAVTNKK